MQHGGLHAEKARVPHHNYGTTRPPHGVMVRQVGQTTERLT